MRWFNQIENNKGSYSLSKLWWKDRCVALLVLIYKKKKEEVTSQLQARFCHSLKEADTIELDQLDHSRRTTYTEALKEQFAQKRKFSHCLLTPTLIESHVMFYSPQNISWASQQNSSVAFY